MMKALAAFIMRGQPHAIAVTAGLAVLSLLFPLLGLLSAAALGLVTLRVGPMAGLLVLVASSVLVTGVAMFTATPLIMPATASLLLLVLWLAAVVLRATRSLPLAIIAISALGVLSVVIFHLLVGDAALWWKTHFDALFAQAIEAMTLDQQMAFKENLETWSAIMTGFVAMIVSLQVVFSLFIARSWQAVLYNPGGFRQEFRGLRFGKQIAIVSLVIVILTFIPSFIAAISADLLMLVLMLYVLQGVAAIHAIAGMKGLNWPWLLGFYLVVILAPQLVAIAGYADTWLDFRKRAAKPGQTQ